MTSRCAGVVVAAAALLLVLTGCGDDDPAATASDTSSESSTPAESPSESDTPAGEESTSAEATETTAPAAPLPACSDIWVDDGRKLPGRYRGCSEGGTDVPAARRDCSFGQPLITYGNRFYAVPRGPINRTEKPLAKDRDYRSALASCTA